MRIEYVSHACLHLRTPDVSIVTDPWFDGPCYLNQWHVFPKPVDLDFAEETDVLVITHGHEDHLHAPTLARFPKNAAVYYPYQWTRRSLAFLRRLGFAKVHEMMTFKERLIAPGVKLTMVANGLDSIAVIEHDGQVIVDLNDALNAHHKFIVQRVASQIKKRWPRIDVMICGLGGAGYFPNNVHCNGKDDLEIGELREQFLAYKFCEIVHILQPHYVVPFVPGFALLDRSKQWINETRISRDLLKAYYHDYFDPSDKVQFVNMLPGDVLEDGNWLRLSPYHAQAIDDKLGHLVPEVYASEIEQYNRRVVVPEAEVAELADLLSRTIRKSARVFSRDVLSRVNFVVRFTDVLEPACIRVAFHGEKLRVYRLHNPPDETDLVVSTTTDRLRYALENPWGGDVFMIGYGADIDIVNKDCLEDNMDIIALRLLATFPTTSSRAIREPLRTMRFMMANPALAALAIRQKVMANGNPNKLPFNERDHWLTKNKCEICRACNVPLLSSEFLGSLEAAAGQEAL